MASARPLHRCSAILSCVEARPSCSCIISTKIGSSWGGRTKTFSSFSSVRSRNSTLSLCSRRSRMNSLIRYVALPFLRVSSSSWPSPESWLEARLEPQPVPQLRRARPRPGARRPRGATSPRRAAPGRRPAPSSRRGHGVSGHRRSCNGSTSRCEAICPDDLVPELVGTGDPVDVEDAILVRLVAEAQQFADRLALPLGQGQAQLLADDGLPAEEVAPLQRVDEVVDQPLPGRSSSPHVPVLGRNRKWHVRAESTRSPGRRSSLAMIPPSHDVLPGRSSSQPLFRHPRQVQRHLAARPLESIFQDLRRAILGPLEEVGDVPRGRLPAVPVPRRRGCGNPRPAPCGERRVCSRTGDLEAVLLDLLQVVWADRPTILEVRAVYRRWSAIALVIGPARRGGRSSSRRRATALILLFFPRTTANRGPPSSCSHSTLIGLVASPTDRQGAWR